MATGVGRTQTQTASVHKLRREARKRERRYQELLTAREEERRRFSRRMGVQEPVRPMPDTFPAPSWAMGARVERIGLFQHAVVLTEAAGS